MKKTILPIILLVCGSLSYAFEILKPATQLEKGRGSFSLEYFNASKTFSFSQKSSDRIAVNNINYYSDVSSTFESDVKTSALMARYEINPNNDLYYWFKFGLGNFELEIPSSTVKNRLSGTENGWIAGLGATKLLFPDTIVTPAISLDLGAVYSQYGLNSFKPGNDADQVVSNELSFLELQVAAKISKNYRFFEPYGGVKIFRTYATIRDKSTTAVIDGSKDNIGIFAGSKIKFFNKESLIVEGSFIGESSFSASWNIDF